MNPEQYKQFNDMKKQIETLTKQVNDLTTARNVDYVAAVTGKQYKDFKLFSSTGTPSTNSALRTITIGMGGGSATVLNYPQQWGLLEYQSKVYAVPIYEASQVKYD